MILPLSQLFAPMLGVFAAMYLLAPTFAVARPSARIAVFIAVWLVVARYLEWRVFTTVLPASGSWYQVGWIWFCLFVELLTFTDQFILYLTFLRRTDRRSEADQHERRLRGLLQDELPSVDVFIPTYDEPLDVLEKTITGALCLDYPNFQVWVLDDGRRPWLKELCERKGAGYLTRSDNLNAKAGNINHALTMTHGDFFAIFDADFVPQRNFLMRTMGFFADPKIAIVQIPHAFYNEDPMQANLGLHRRLPDEQRFFFDCIMPARDGWDGAFCCGSNSVTRRAALRTVGDCLPTQSITEDILLTLVLLRKGYVTRYSLRTAGNWPCAGKPWRVFRATATLGARRDPDPVSRRRAARPRTEPDASAPLLSDSLALTGLAGAHGRGGSDRLHVDWPCACRRRHP